MKAHLIRTAMIGGGTRYDVYIPISEIPTYRPERHTTICQDGQQYWDYSHATLPASHYEMESGWEKYENWNNHDEKARIEMLAILKKHFPETAHLKKFPVLWVNEINMPSALIEAEV